MENNSQNSAEQPQTQPTTPAAPAPKKTNTGLIIGIVIGAVVLFVILPMVFLWMIFSGVLNIGMARYRDTRDIIEELEKVGESLEIEEKVEDENKVAAVWNCASGTGSADDREKFKTTVELNKDMTFRYGPYGDLANNHFSGTYTFEDEHKQTQNGDYKYYMVKFNTTEFMEDGEVQELKNLSDMEMGITKTDEGRGAITIFVASYNMYYCYDY